MNLVDSSGWLEFFANETNADFFTPAIEDPPQLIVPCLSIYEVFKRVLQQRDEDQALQAIAVMQQGLVIDLTATLSLKAAKISITHKLPLADSIMLATAQAYDAIFWTQDGDFKDIEDVRYVTKKR
jgi:predicted nucleic acid-binding protein